LKFLWFGYFLFHRLWGKRCLFNAR